MRDTQERNGRNFLGEKEKFPCQKYREEYNLISSDSVEVEMNPG